jgi:hypothetical protein
LGSKPWSAGLEREAVWLSGSLGSFEQVETVLKRVGQVDMSRSSVWRSTQRVGGQFQAIAAAERARANALPPLGARPQPAAPAAPRLGVAMDGFILNLRQEGWKESKIASVYEVAARPTQDAATGELVDLAHAVNLSYVAHLGGPERLGEMAWGEAARRGWEHAADTQVLGDGAVWIWHQAALHFGDSRQLVDWYHAKDHLSEAARLLKGDDTPANHRWLNQHETLLYQGHADAIASELHAVAQRALPHAEALAAEATYFQRNQLRMNYLEMREEAWPIGSGMIESAAKQYKARFCATGMRWSRSGAENLLPIRSAVLSQRFDQLYATAQNLPPS